MTTNKISWRALIGAGMAVLVCIFLFGVGSSSAQSPTTEPDKSQQEGQLFLPVISGGVAQTPDNIIDTADGRCPTGFHLIHRDGARGFVDPDGSEEITDWSDYGCQPDQPLESAACGPNGIASLIGGVVACSCSEGYSGAQCNSCAWGYERNTPDAPCLLKQQSPPAATIEGAAQSVEYGATTLLRAVEPVTPQANMAQSAAPQEVSGVWSVVSGDGCLVASEASAECVEQIAGTTAHFKTPQSGDSLGVAVVQFTPDCCTDQPLFETVLATPPGHIPVTGWGSSFLKPLLDEIIEYMVEHCVGAGVLGVSYYGEPVGMWGLGKLYGRASSAILDPLCGDNSVDPHFPEQPNVTPDTPMMIGSVSKVFTFSVARWVLKERLQEIDTDVATVALSNQHLVTAIRTGDNLLQMDSWAINNNGVTGHLGTDQAGQARDFSLASISANRFVAGVRTLDNNLKMIVWDMDGNGALQRVGEDQAGQIKQVRVAQVGADKVVAAVRLADDQLRLIVWRVLANGQLERLDDADAGKVRDLSIAMLPGATPDRVVTAVRTENNLLKVIVWDIDADGIIARRGDGEEAGEINGVQITALAATRVVVATPATTGNLKLTVWSIDANGNPTRQGMDETGVVTHFSLATVGPSSFAAGVATESGNLRVITWLVDNQGEVERRGEEDAGPIHGIAMDNATYGSETLTSVLFTAVRTATHNLKLIAWNATGPTPFRLDNEADGDPIVDFAWSDADIEALPLLGYDIPEGLLPYDLHRFFAGEQEVPVKLASSAGDLSCEAPEQFADPQWRQLTLKNLFGHRTGMPKSAPSHEGLMRDYLPALRGLESQADYAAQEQLMRDKWGESYIENARAALGWGTELVEDGPTDGYLAPVVSLDEVLTAVAGRCLVYDLSGGNYSNTTPQIMRAIIEHVSGVPYSAEVGFPDTHNGSLVDQFFAAQPVFIESQPLSGIYQRPQAANAQGEDIYPGAVGRMWDNGTYYPTGGDLKRPHCLWQDGDCAFNEWYNDMRRVNWNGNLDPYLIPLTSTGDGAATGGMVVEVEPMLTFLANYWTAGYDGDLPNDSFNPWIGEPRNNTWNIDSHHNGSVSGGVARADQIVDPDLNIYGVDVFVAFNQNANKRCVENEDASGCSDNLYWDVVKKGVDAVDWTKVTPPVFQTAP